MCNHFGQELSWLFHLSPNSTYVAVLKLCRRAHQRDVRKGVSTLLDIFSISLHCSVILRKRWKALRSQKITSICTTDVQSKLHLAESASLRGVITEQECLQARLTCLTCTLILIHSFSLSHQKKKKKKKDVIQG